MRFAEIALLALPFVVFVAWRLLAPVAARPPKSLVIAVAGTVLAMAGLLLGLWYEEAEAPGVGYVPARIENGRVVPERNAPITRGRTEPGAPESATSVPMDQGAVDQRATGRADQGAVDQTAPGRVLLVPDRADQRAMDQGRPGRVDQGVPGQNLLGPGQPSPAGPARP